MATNVGGARLPNPVMTASGTAGHGAELGAYFDLSRLGAIVVKSLSAQPWAGNPAPRLWPVAGGMLNSIGLQNPGVEAWLHRDLEALARAGARVVVSVWGRTIADYAEVGRRLARGLVEAGLAGGGLAGGGLAGGGLAGGGLAGGGLAGGGLAGGGLGAPVPTVVAVEANISCPNIEDRQRMFSHSPEGAGAALRALAEALAPTGLPIWAKLSPNVTDLVAIAQAALAGGATALTLVNTLMGMAIDPATGRARLGAGGGGLSGPALHPVAVRAVYECRRALPAAAIIGVGGVVTGEDAAELLCAGADAVQVGTATFVDPRAPLRVLDELVAWCTADGIKDLSQLSGRSHRLGTAGPAGPEVG